MTFLHTRNESEMFDLILEFARTDKRIRAVILNGSRVNPHVRPDAFQDFDIVYVVTDVESFIRNESWLDRFGPLMILQTPDDMGEAAVNRNPDEVRMRYTWLAQFQDGNRIDLTVVHVDNRHTQLEDSLRRLLLDKDGLFEPFPDSDDGYYHIAPPTDKQFRDCCNEFFWVAPYAAKGIWRGQPVYGRNGIEALMRPQLMKMLDWYAGLRGGYAVTTGAYGKCLHEHLEPALWDMLQRTWKDGDPGHMWSAIFNMIRLFRLTAGEVAKAERFAYPTAEDHHVSAFLRHIRKLPPDADVIYP